MSFPVQSYIKELVLPSSSAKCRRSLSFPVSFSWMIRSSDAIVKLGNSSCAGTTMLSLALPMTAENDSGKSEGPGDPD